MFRLVSLAEKGWGPMMSPLMESMLAGTGTLDVPSGDSSLEGLGPNGEPSCVNAGRNRDIRCSAW
jgi:hypothetical protein